MGFFDGLIKTLTFPTTCHLLRKLHHTRSDFNHAKRVERGQGWGGIPLVFSLSSLLGIFTQGVSLPEFLADSTAETYFKRIQTLLRLVSRICFLLNY